MLSPVRTAAHYAGDLTAAFLYPVFAAMFDALWGSQRPKQ
jgi:hypothetical protein